MKVKLQIHASVSEIRNLPQFAAVSESERMYALLSRRLVQKSRLKMGPMDTSGRHEYALQNQLH